jgi:hypothetical protein
MGRTGYDSYLVRTCHRLRRKPLTEFTVEDLRIMIGQEIGLPILILLAVEQLEVEPLAQGDFYPGDLLSAVLRIDESFWSSHPDSLQRIRQVVRRANESLLGRHDDEFQAIRSVLGETPLQLIE